MRRFVIPAAIALLTFATSWRAATQAITTDEAFTYNSFIAPGWQEVLAAPYDANHHVLNTLLAAGSVRLFGLKEWALRLPAVIAGVFYLLAAWRLARRSGSLDLWVFGLLALNPYVREFFSLARGYGIALALLLWALAWILESLDHERDCWTEASAAMGLAIAANLTLVFPVAAVTAAVAALRGGRLAFNRLAVPAATVSCLLLGIPLSHASAENFYYGSPTLAAALQSLAERSVDGLPAVGWGGVFVSPGVIASALALPGALLLASLPVWVVYKHRRDGDWVLVAAFSGTLALLQLAHMASGVKFPLGRTGLYLIPIASLCAAIAAGARPALARPLLLAAILVYSTQFSWEEFQDWKPDAASRELARQVETATAGGGAQLVCSPLLEPVLNYYRQARHWSRGPLDRKGADRDAQLYALLPEDSGLVAKRSLEVVWRGPSGVLLARVAGAR